MGEGVYFGGNGAFENCTALETIELPDSCKIIYNDTFAGCSKLSSVKIPDACIRIESSAFYKCESLQEIVLPESLRDIFDYAFYFCKNLKKVTFLNPKCDFRYANEKTFCTGFKDEKPYFDGVICGYEGSTAQRFAEQYNLTFESLGAVPAATTTAKVTTTTAKAAAATTKAVAITAKAITATAPVTTAIPTEMAPVVTTSASPALTRGDVTGDGDVSVDDAQFALKAYTNQVAGKGSGLSEAQYKAANVNHDAELSVDDVQNILKYYTEKKVAGKKDITWDDILGK